VPRGFLAARGPLSNFRVNATGRVCSARSPRTAIAFFSRFEEYVTGDHAKHFILALCEEFEDDLIVVLDGAPYFQASAVTDLAARDDLAFVTLPAYSPEPNPVEECWRQLQQALGNRFFDSFDELTTATGSALDQLSLPKVSNYF
jgi:transposase